MRAGADRREQKKEAAKHERDLLIRMRGDKSITQEEVDREKAAAIRADKAGPCPSSLTCVLLFLHLWLRSSIRRDLLSLPTTPNAHKHAIV